MLPNLTLPVRQTPAEDWEHHAVWQRVYNLIEALPNYFESEIRIKGINVTDIFSVGNLFSAVIESQIVDILNRLRNVWDDENRYSSYIFKRQAQTFPDILFVNAKNGNDIIFGIELKAWYVFSKESEPSFRYTIDPDACNIQDLLVVVPWYLSDIISGNPKLFTPYIEFGRYAAEYRNYYWMNSRIQSGLRSSDIIRPLERYRHPYPQSKMQASNKAEGDGGGNFGRIARAGLLDDYLQRIKSLDSLGIKVVHWMKFFKAMSENSSDLEIERQLDSLIPLLKSDLSVSEQKQKFNQSVLEIINNLKLMGDF